MLMGLITTIKMLYDTRSLDFMKGYR